MRGWTSTLPNPYFYFVFLFPYNPQTHTFTERGLGGLAGGHCCQPRGRRPLAGLLGRGKGDPQLSTQRQQPHTPSTQWRRVGVGLFSHIKGVRTLGTISKPLENCPQTTFHPPNDPPPLTYSNKKISQPVKDWAPQGWGPVFGPHPCGVFF